MRFTPRVVYSKDVLSFGTNIIKMKPGLTRFYEITDICKFNQRYYLVTACDRHEDIIHIKEITVY